MYNSQRLRAVFSFVIFLVTQQQAFAASPVASSPGKTSTIAASKPAAISLDLSSTSQSVSAGHLTQSKPVTINVGGTTQSVTASSMLTPAERLAVYQVLSSGQQSILLGVQGNAVGGSFTIGSKFSQYVSNLVIPQGVTGIDNASKNPSLTLSGNLTNAGTLYAVSTNPSVNSASISAANIFNQSGALISSNLPGGGLAGMSNSISGLSLTLNALQTIVNAGTISSAGNLSLTAGGSITNALAAGVTGTRPVIQALGNLSLNSAAGSIINSGLMAAVAGNLNLVSQSLNALSINNAGGTLQALNGSVELRSPDYAGNADTTLTGGDVLSQSLDVYAGGGTANVNVGQLSGVINASGNAVHVVADTDSLSLGAINLSGDPTFYNDAAGGSITINGDISVSEDLTIAADGNISTTGTNAITITTNNSGGHINILAGVGIDASSCSGCEAQSGSLTGTFSDGGGNVPAGQSITVTGPSAGGGNINFSNNTVTLDVSNSGGKAGNIALIAAQGSTSHTGGLILMPTSTLNATGNTVANTGTVSIVAGGSNGTSPSIEVQNIMAKGILIETSQVNALTGVTVNGNGHISTSAPPVTYQPNGQVEVFAGLNGVSGTSINIEAPKLVNNGTITSTLANIIVSDGITTGSAGLTVSGTGTFTTPSTGIVVFESSTSVIFDAGMSQTVTGGGTVDIRTPLLEANAGSAAVLNATNGQGINVTGDLEGIGDTSLTFASVGGAGTIELEGAPVMISSTSQVFVDSGVTLSGTGGDGRIVVLGTIAKEGPSLTVAAPGGAGTFISASGISFTAQPGEELLLDHSPTTLNLDGPSTLSAPGEQGEVTLEGTDSIFYTQNVIINSPTVTNSDRLFSLASAAGVTVNPSGTAPNPQGAEFTISTPFLQNLGTITAQALPPPPPSAAPAPSPPSSQLLPSTESQGELPIFAFSSSNNTNNEAIDNRLPTDYTPWGTYPGDKNTYYGGKPPGSHLFKYWTTAVGDPISGWQFSIDAHGNGVWSCPGCVSTSQGAAGSSQNATRMFQRAAENVESMPENELLVDAQLGASSGANSSSAKSSPRGVNSGSDSQFIKLPQGVMIITANSPMVVSTQEGNVHVEKGSQIFVVETGHDVAVYDLNDPRSGGVQLVVGKRLLRVRPGQQVVLTRKQTDDFDKVNPGKGIGYRNPYARDLGDGTRAFVADFSIPSAISALPPLRQMLKSQNAQDRAATARLLKSAVIMSDLSAAAGPYRVTQ